MLNTLLNQLLFFSVTKLIFWEMMKAGVLVLQGQKKKKKLLP